MTFRLVDAGWASEFEAGLSLNAGKLLIVCPFIKEGVVDTLLAYRPRGIRIITRFNLNDFADGVSDIAALQKLIGAGAKIRGIRNLHAKLYLFGNSRAIVTSANLTESGLRRNAEFGMVTEDDSAVASCRAYFDSLWQHCSKNLQSKQLDKWQKRVKRHLVAGDRARRVTRLKDYGVSFVNSGLNYDSASASFTDQSQAFVKFLGRSRRGERAPLSFSILEEIKQSGCHQFVCYSKNKRPRRVEDGATVFISRLVQGRDIRVFGRGIGVKYEEKRDDAKQADIELREWRKNWPHFIRVHHAEFVSGTMENGISMNDLMNDLQEHSFASTQRNAKKGDGSNIDPRKAYVRQADVELSREGFRWLDERLQAAFERYGKIPEAELDNLD